VNGLEATVAELKALGLGPKPATAHVALQWDKQESDR
jgi:hypothetical protein